MNCEQARQLFDAFLEGDLPVMLATELGAHRVQCAECRRALALLEVSGHVLATDEDPVTLDGDFTDRLLACVEHQRRPWHVRAVRSLYIGGPLAAAAVVALAFVGVFDGNGESAVRGQKVTGPAATVFVEDSETIGHDASMSPSGPAASESIADEQWERWLRQTQQNIDAKRQSGDSLHQMLNLTVSQWIDIIEQAKRSSDGERPSGEAESIVPAQRQKKAPKEGADVEDL